MFPRHAFHRAVLLTALFTLLASCGGGGGGGGGDAPKPTPGGFSISTSAVSFTLRQGKGLPAAQHVQVQLADSTSAAFGAAWVAPQQPVSWLTPTITGAAPNYDLALSVNNSGQTLGTQVVTLTVGTADANGTILQTKPIQITLNVQAPISSTTTQISAPGFVLGAAASTQTFNVPVQADASTTWSVLSNKSWIKVPANPQTGNGTVTITLDSTNLDVGATQGSVTIVNASDPLDNIAIPVMTEVVLPALTVSPSTITLGGADGFDMTGNQPLQVSVSTGTNQYPWTATLSMASGSGWLGANLTSGAAGATPSTLTVTGNRNAVVPGSYTGSVRIDLTIGTHVLTQTIPVTLNREGHWINVSSTGAAFSKFPSRSVLTRNIQVVSSLGRTDVPWTAVSDKPWLTVTPSGVTGGTITLTADPTGQPVDQPLIAEVLVKSSDASVANEETIRVGLWVGNTDPTDFSYATPQYFVVANPVEPYVYANSKGTDVSVYNVYSGALVNTLHNVVALAGSMTISTDGTLLFVSDDTNHRIVELDAATGAEIQRFPWAGSSSLGIAYARPNAQPVLMLGDGSTFDVGTGESYGYRSGVGSYYGMASFGVDGLSRYLYAQDMGLSGSTLTQYSLKYTALGNTPLVIKITGGASGGSNGRDICAAADGSRVYTANGAPYEFHAFSATDMHDIQTLPAQPYPNNAACGWNGLFVGGIQFSYSTDNVWVYRPDGTKVTSFNLDPGGSLSGLLADTLVLSGDNTRVIGSTESPSSFQFRNLPPP